MTNKNNLAVYESLSIVRLHGFEPPRIVVEEFDIPTTPNGVDEVGSANAFVEAYGHAAEPDPNKNGIIWTDYSFTDRYFSVLIDSPEVVCVIALAAKMGYSIVSVEKISTPIEYGDYDGAAVVMQHPGGWVVAF